MVKRQTQLVAPTSEGAYPERYREVLIEDTLFKVRSVFKGEKELAPTLESLAISYILEEIAKITDKVNI